MSEPARRAPTRRLARALGALAAASAIALAASTFACPGAWQRLTWPLQRVETQNMYDAPPEGAARVLFVGNSMTFANRMPEMVQRLVGAHPDGREVWIGARTYPGVPLEWLAEHGATRADVLEGGWDVVVLQPYCCLSKGDHQRPLDQLAELAARAGARVVVYDWVPVLSTHRRYYDAFAQEGDAPRDPAWLVGNTSAWIEEAAARHPRVSSGHVGRAFLACSRTPARERELYGADGAHPSGRGSYLIAASLARAVTGLDVSRSSWAPGGIPDEDAARLRACAQAAASSAAAGGEASAAGAQDPGGDLAP